MLELNRISRATIKCMSFGPQMPYAVTRTRRSLMLDAIGLVPTTGRGAYLLTYLTVAGAMWKKVSGIATWRISTYRKFTAACPRGEFRQGFKNHHRRTYESE